MITKLTRLTIETGTATALVALTYLFLFFKFPETNYYAVPVLIIAKLYCNTLLVLFNSRMRITGGREEDAVTTTAIDLSTRPQAITFSRPPSSYLQDWRILRKDGLPSDATEPASSGQAVRVTTDVYMASDEMQDSPGAVSKPHALTGDQAA